MFEISEFLIIEQSDEMTQLADGIRVEYLPRFTTLQLCNKVQEFMSKMSEPSEFKGRIIFMSMFNDISWGSEDNEQELQC